MPDLVLLHFDPPYEHAGHYLLYSKRTGFGSDYARRVIAGELTPPHPLVLSAIIAGCRVSVAAVFHGANRAERYRLRRNGGLSRFCPTCQATGRWHR